MVPSSKINAYLVEIEFVRDLIAGYNKKYYDFRIFRRGSEVKILYKNDPSYKEKKESLLKGGFVDMDYIFPRFVNRPFVIDWFSYFANPIYFIVSKNTNLKVTDIHNVNADELKVGYKGEYHSKTGSPVYHEMVEAGSTLRAVVFAKGELKEEVEVVGKIGRYKNRGFGKYVARIKELSEANVDTD